MIEPASHPQLAEPPPLRTSLARPHPGSIVLDVHGEIDTLTAPPLEQAMHDLIADPVEDRLVVDLSGVTFLASSGLAVLVRAAHRASRHGRRLRLVATARAVRRPLQITGSDQLFDMYQNVSEALDTGR